MKDEKEGLRLKLFLSSVVMGIFFGVAYITHALAGSPPVELTQYFDEIASGDLTHRPQADAIFQNSSITKDDWENFFNEYFNTDEKPLTNYLWEYLVVFPLFSPNFSPVQGAIQEGISEPLRQKILDIMALNPMDTLDEDVNLCQSLMNSHKIFAEIGDHGVIGESPRMGIFNDYQSLIQMYPDELESGNLLDVDTDPHMGAIRAQAWMAFRDILSDSNLQIYKGTLSSTLGLGELVDQGYQEIWDRPYSTLLHDNYSDSPLNGFSSGQKNVIKNMMDLIPVGLPKPGNITQAGLVGLEIGPFDSIGCRRPFVPPLFSDSTHGQINIFKTKLTEPPENVFPDELDPNEFPEVYISFFASGLAHELNHVVDFFIIFKTPNLLVRKDQLIQNAGSADIRNYLRSNIMPDPSFFINAPQEFFASIANQWFSSSKLTLELGILRFDAGFSEPLNQALYFANNFEGSFNQLD